MFGNSDPQIDAAYEEIQELRAEIGRLRAEVKTLRNVAVKQHEYIERARAALEFYADPFGRCDQVPDFYSELNFGDRAYDALHPSTSK